MRSLLLMVVGVACTLVGTAVWLQRQMHGAHSSERVASHDESHAVESEEHGSDEHGEEGGHGGGEHGGGAVSIFQDRLPREIRDRQDGQMEAGHDLVDPDIHALRGLASLTSNEIKSQRAFYSADFPEIMAGTRPGDGFSGKAVTTISLAVTSSETEHEVVQRAQEFQGLIIGLISSMRRDVLLTHAGRERLKTDIQREVNYRLKTGRVKDVLFLNFFVL